MLMQDLELSRKLYGMIAQQTVQWLLQLNAIQVKARKSSQVDNGVGVFWDVSWTSHGDGGEFTFSGVLQLRQSQLVFSSKMLGFLKKEAFGLSNVLTCEVQGNTGCLTTRGPHAQRRLTFKCLSGFSETEQVVSQIRAAASSAVSTADDSALLQQLEEEEARRPADPMALTSGDWEALTQGAKKVVFKRDEAVMREGESYQRMFQIVRGVIRVEKRSAEESLRLGELRASETFGELSFLTGSAATATCIVDSDEAELVIIEGYYLNMLFRIRPEIAGRFYKFLSLLVTARVHNSPYATS
jgi:hypothetical protein